MYFCPNCSYALDISKSNIQNIEEKVVINDPDELISKFKKKSNLSNYSLFVDKEELIKNKKYDKLSSKNKDILLGFLENISSDVMFKCNNCDYSENINKSILLYSHVISENDDNDVYNKITLNDYKLMVKNPIYSRTRDYNCKNVKCVTHTNKIEKEAIYFRNPKNYEITYVCNTCYHPWTV